MGVENYLLSSCLIGVLAQRLVRIICKECRVEYLEEAERLRALGLELKGESRGRLPWPGL